jgi:hypothetical protein
MSRPLPNSCGPAETSPMTGLASSAQVITDQVKR